MFSIISWCFVSTIITEELKQALFKTLNLKVRLVPLKGFSPSEIFHPFPAPSGVGAPARLSIAAARCPSPPPLSFPALCVF